MKFSACIHLITYSATSDKSDTRSITCLCLFFLKRNIDNPVLTQTRQLSSWYWSKQRSTNREMPHADAILLFTPPSIDPERSSGRFPCKKTGDLQVEEMSPPFQSEHASKTARRSRPGHARTWWHHITGPPSKQVARSLESMDTSSS